MPMTYRFHGAPPVGLFLLAALLGVGPVAAATASIPASKDNTLYESAAGNVSNGAGQVFFAGRTSTFTNSLRRGLIAFDIAGVVPAGSTIDGVRLRLHLTRVPLPATQTVITLHRLLADWGEGASDPEFQEGGGAPAEPGDATWLHRFFNTSLWTSQGGDFVAASSASASVLDVGPYVWGPTAEMRADVQGWLDNPTGNFGWIVRGVEPTLQSARGFDTRQGLVPEDRPMLEVTFTPLGSGAGRVPDGSTAPEVPLRITPAANSAISLTWGGSCLATDTDYEVYEGILGSFYSHGMKLCSTGGATTAIFVPGLVSYYYLVVPHHGGLEGSYGLNRVGAERPPGVPACLPQSIATCP
jgi:hypothetical protein